MLQKEQRERGKIHRLVDRFGGHGRCSFAGSMSIKATCRGLNGGG